MNQHTEFELREQLAKLNAMLLSKTRECLRLSEQVESFKASGVVEITTYDSFQSGFCAGAEAMRAVITQEMTKRAEEGMESISHGVYFGIAASICSQMPVPKVVK